jgi:hypothetical protein
MQTATLRPGLIVSLKTSVRGNVRYTKRDIESEHTIESGALKAVWETERMVSDPEEFERAKVARGKARSLVTGICALSAFGLLCPENRAGDLEGAIAEARDVARQFNDSARLSKIDVYVITGRIAENDVEAIRAISSEIRDLIDDMARGVENLDAEAVRTAANKARNIGQMLSPEAARRVKDAIDAARSAARKIVKAGEQASTEIDVVALRAITEARTAFLDLDDVAAAVVESVAPASRAVDFEPEAVAMPIAAEAYGSPQLDLL